MVLFDDRRDKMPPIDKQQWQVLMNAHLVADAIDLIQGLKNEQEIYESRVKLLKSMRYLNEECNKLKELYKREGIKE